jgi:hypothetical protein
MEKLTFLFLSEYCLHHFVLTTKCVSPKPNMDLLSVECNCKGKELREGMAEEAQKNYCAMVIREETAE